MSFKNLEDALEQLSEVRIQEQVAVENIMNQVSELVDSLTMLQAIARKRIGAAQSVSRYIETTTNPGGAQVSLEDLEPILDKLWGVKPYVDAYNEMKKENK